MTNVINNTAMERTVVLVRHAKAASGYDERDFDRKLTESGKEDAVVIGQRLAAHGFIPDAILCSSAKRTKQTAKRLAAACNFDKEEITLTDAYYQADYGTLQKGLTRLDSTVKTAYVVAHNPGITDFANTINEHFSIDDMPTCCAIVFKFNAGSWADMAQAVKEVVHWDYPRKQNQ